MTNFSEDLKQRIPEYMQGESDLTAYLDACGEVFDELGDNIKQHDVYKDYHRVPEARLSLLAKRFAFEPPRQLPPELTRGIIRDIAGIYTTKGVEHSLTWIFRLIGWKSTIEYAWLLNPERYDPNIKTEYPRFFERDGLNNDISSLNTFIPPMNVGYRIGDFRPEYHADPDNYFVDGHLLIGRNNITPITGEGNPYLSDISMVSTDFTKIDYRNFVYGESRVTSKGSLFYGHTYFSKREDIKDAKIIGESYRTEDIIKYHPSVISTPYIVVKVDSEDYDKFTRPYIAADGELYSYTNREKFSIAETLIEFLLFEFIRPANVRIILVVSEYQEEDYLSINDGFQTESYAYPIEYDERLDISSSSSATIPVTIPVIGSENFYLGMPSYLPYNSLMQTEKINIGQQSPLDIIDNHDTYYYWRMRQEVLDLGGGIYETPSILLRSPSRVMVSTDETITVFGRVSVEHPYIELGTLTKGLYVLEAFDYINIKFRTTTLDAFINIRVVWDDSSTYTGSFSPTLKINLTQDAAMLYEDGVSVLVDDTGTMLGFQESVNDVS